MSSLSSAAETQHIVLLEKTNMAHHQLEAEDPTEIRIALVGKTGVGKSAVGNTILGRRAFESKVSLSSVTSECKKAAGAVDGQPVAVVDTPGLFDTRKTLDEVKTEVVRSVSFAAPGPHVFLIVIQLNRFTKEEQKTVKILQEMFEEEAGKYSMVLFTHGDALEKEGVTIETLISDSKPLSDFIRQCGGGHHVFNNRDMENRVQVTELLKKIDTMVQTNGGSYYTTEMFQAAEKAIREEQERLLKENPDMDPAEASKKAKEDNSFIWTALGLGAAGAAAGAAGTAAAAGAVGGAVGGPVGVAVGAVGGAAVGAATAVLIKKACSIQ